LLEILREYGKGGQAQFIIATHSPILLALDHAAIFSFDQSPAGPVTYKETAHYQIYKRFLMER
jgi:predicted ATPase